MKGGREGGRKTAVGQQFITRPRRHAIYFQVNLNAPLWAL